MAVTSSECFPQSVNVHVCVEQFLKGHPNRQHLYKGFGWLRVCKIRAQFVHFIFFFKSGHDLLLIEMLQEKKLGKQKSCLLPRLSTLRNKLFDLGNRTFYLVNCISPPCHWNMRDLSGTLKGISSNLLKPLSLAHWPLTNSSHHPWWKLFHSHNPLPSEPVFLLTISLDTICPVMVGLSIFATELLCY